MADAPQLRRQLARQVNHWCSAATRLGRLENLAGRVAWDNLEQYLGVSVRAHLTGVVARLVRRGDLLRAALAAADGERELAAVRAQLLDFRRRYLRAETTVDFYADAINTRTNPTLGSVLRACDTLAYRSMSGVLEPLGLEAPVALTYFDKGLGASILKAGLRLWDGGSSSVAAAIKLVPHNVERPTSLIHEAGHQVAHIAGWNDDLAHTLETGLGGGPLGRTWGGWASEIAADAIAFVHTGYGSVVALHDVLAAEPDYVFQLVPGDPHPMSFLRVELGVEMCRLAWGKGPWDELSDCWRQVYPMESAPALPRALIAASTRALPTIARLTLATPGAAFRGRSLVDIVSPQRVSPQALEELERKLGPALYTSPHWIWTECLRLLAITALRDGSDTPHASAAAPSAAWMLRLGGVQEAA